MTLESKVKVKYIQILSLRLKKQATTTFLLIVVHILHQQKVSEYDQEKPQSHTADQPMAP